MLMRFDPFSEIDRVTRMLGQQAVRSAAMPMDAYRAGDRFVVHFDLPGVKYDSIDLTVEKNVLTVKAQRSWQPSEQQELLVSERPQGTFSRQLILGESLDSDGVEATYRDGVLSLMIPVIEQDKPRKVEVTTASKSDTIDASSTDSGGRSTDGSSRSDEHE